MILNQLMALLLPSIVTLKMYEKLEGEENRVQKVIKKYLKAVLIVNTVAYAFTIYIVQQNQFVFTNQFTFKYILLATAIAIIYPIIEKNIRTNVKVEVEIKDEKQD